MKKRKSVTMPAARSYDDWVAFYKVLIFHLANHSYAENAAWLTKGLEVLTQYNVRPASLFGSLHGPAILQAIHSVHSESLLLAPDPSVALPALYSAVVQLDGMITYAERKSLAWSATPPRSDENFLAWMAANFPRFEIFGALLAEEATPAARYNTSATMATIASSIANQGGALVATAPSADATTETLQTFLLPEVRRWGNNVFVLDDALHAKFLHTDVDNLDIGAVEFPYPAFLIRAPERNYLVGRVAVVGHSLVLSEGVIGVWGLLNHDRGALQLMQTTTMRKLGDLWDACDRALRAYPHYIESGIQQACREAFLVTCNLSLYLSTKEPVVTKTRDRVPDFKREEKRKAWARYTPITHRISAPRAQGVKLGGTTTSGSTRLHWVRGHWRKQWKGSRSEGTWAQGLTWIHPHLRGTELTLKDSSNPRKYKV